MPRIESDFLRFYLGIDVKTCKEVDDTIELLNRLINDEQSLDSLKINVLEYKIQHTAELEAEKSLKAVYNA